MILRNARGQIPPLTNDMKEAVDSMRVLLDSFGTPYLKPIVEDAMLYCYKLGKNGGIKD